MGNQLFLSSGSTAAPQPCPAALAGKTIVIKYGGNAMISDNLRVAVMEDVVALQKGGAKVVLLHGGGAGISEMLRRLKVPSHFVNGSRHTSPEILRIAKMVMIGDISTDLVSDMLALGGSAIALSGVSGALFLCHQQSEEMGLVGDIDEVNLQPLSLMLEAGYVPIIAPIGTDGKGCCFNLNADTAAGFLAEALKADKFILLTDIAGLCNSVERGDVISYLNPSDVPRLKARGIISGGMIPKIDSCLHAVAQGVGEVHIVDGRKPHCVMHALLEGSGGTTVGTAHESIGIAAE